MDNAILRSPEKPLHNLVVSSTLPESSTPHGDSEITSPSQVPVSQSTNDNMGTDSVQPYHQFPGQPVPIHPAYVPVDHSSAPRSLSLDAQAAQQGSFNMVGMQRALPVPIYPQGHPQQQPLPQQPHMGHPPPPPRHLPSHQRFPTGASTAAVAFQLSQQMHQYQSGLGGIASSTEQSGQFYSHSQYQQTSVMVDSYGRSYAAPADAAQHGTVVIPYSSSYPPQYQHAMVPVSGHMGQQWYPFQQQPFFYPQPGYPATFHAVPVQQPYMDVPIDTQSSRRHSVPAKQSNINRMADPSGIGSATVPYGPSGSRTAGMSPYGSGPQSQSGSRNSLPRGPPRKPKRTGNALWVGNLPMNTDIADLKDFFSRGYKHDIESIKLMRSNSAFINYKTEAAMNDALNKFHDSRFQGTRLVVRISRESSPATTTTTTQARAPVRSPVVSGPASAQASGDEDGMTPPTVGGEPGEPTFTLSPPSGPSGGSRARTSSKDRYFIIKSVSIEDVEMSVKTGVWATQSHNEEVFNQAYETAENVYLFFSVNRKGEYYGYARMASRIDEEAASSISRLAPTIPDVEVEQEEGIITPETETAPRGRIIDDRDNLFWETLSDSRAEDAAAGAPSDEEEEGGQTTVDGKRLLLGDGKPFKVEWVSTSRVPFLKVRGIRNPWNSNREVKIARDGTEVEPVVGRRLVQLFHGPGNRAGGFSGVLPAPLAAAVLPAAAGTATADGEKE